jgi:hypothetical protein
MEVMNRRLAEFLTPERQRKIIEALAVLNLILLFLGGAYGYALNGVTSQNHRLAKDGKEAHDAICALKQDFRDRISSTQDFLNTHKQKVVLGVPRESIVVNLNNTKSTLRSLNKVSCP